MSYDYYNYPPGDPQTNNYQAQQYYAQNQAAYPQYAGYAAAQQPWSAGWFDFKNPSYLKGLLIAGGITLLATNPTVQKTVLTGLAKAWSGMQYGLEEVKEQINDIKAEMRYKQEQKASPKEEAADA